MPPLGYASDLLVCTDHGPRGGGRGLIRFGWLLAQRGRDREEVKLYM